MNMNMIKKFNNCFTFTFARFYAGFYCFAKNE